MPIAWSDIFKRYIV